MSINDKAKLLSSLKSKAYVSLELGCGNRKRYPNAYGIDILDYSCVDIVGDVLVVLSKFPDNSVDAVYGFHFIEHVDNLQALMGELSRIVKVNGVVEFVAPHFSHPYFYSDPTHKIYFGLYTFCYFVNNSYFSRQVPTYKFYTMFDLQSVDLIFKSSSAFPVRYCIKAFFGYIFNFSNSAKEFYEENLCYLFPCYEIKYRLLRHDRDLCEQ